MANHSQADKEPKQTFATAEVDGGHLPDSEQTPSGTQAKAPVATATVSPDPEDYLFEEERIQRLEDDYDTWVSLGAGPDSDDPMVDNDWIC